MRGIVSNILSFTIQYLYEVLEKWKNYYFSETQFFYSMKQITPISFTDIKK